MTRTQGNVDSVRMVTMEINVSQNVQRIVCQRSVNGTMENVKRVVQLDFLGSSVTQVSSTCI